MVFKVGSHIEPDAWKNEDVSKAHTPINYPRIFAHLAAQAFAAGWQFYRTPFAKLATGNLDPTSIALADIAPFIFAPIAAEYGHKAKEKLKDYRPYALLFGKPSDYLTHAMHCLYQMKKSDFNDYDKAKTFLQALSQHPTYFQIPGWSTEEQKELKNVIKLISADDFEKDDVTEAARKTHRLMIKKRNAQSGIALQMANKLPSFALEGIDDSIMMLSSLLDLSNNSDEHFLRPALNIAVTEIAGLIKKHCVGFLATDEERKALEGMCDQLIKDLETKPFLDCIHWFFNQRIAVAFGCQIPFTHAALEKLKLKHVERQKSILSPRKKSVAELKSETEKLQQDCVEKGSLFAWHYILIQIIAGRNNVDTTSSIKEAYLSDDPVTKLSEIITEQLNDPMVPAWRRFFAMLLWNWTPFYSLTKLMMRRSIDAIEKWIDEKIATKTANKYDISEAKSIEATFKAWIQANLQISDIGSYEDEISAILANSPDRTARINRLINVIVDTCFPAINLISWCTGLDNWLRDSHELVPYIFKPFVWLGSYPIRLALSGIKMIFLASQRIFNFFGRFATKFVIKRLGILHILFDFRLRLQKGDHHNIEAKLKNFTLSIFEELNKVEFGKNPTDEELKRFTKVHHTVVQCVYALLRVLDMHNTSDWSKEGIGKALNGNFIEKEVRERLLPTVIEKIVILFIELLEDFILKPEKYQKARRDIYRAINDSMTDISKPSASIDDEIKTELDIFREKVIRQVILRTLADLGEEKRNKAAAYVAELQKQKPAFKDWQKQLQKLYDNIDKDAAFNTDKIRQDVASGLNTTDGIFKKYRLFLQNVSAKRKEIYNRFSSPMHQIESAFKPLEEHLSSITQHLKIKNLFEAFRNSNWPTLKDTLKSSKSKADAQRPITKLMEAVSCQEYQTDKHLLQQAKTQIETHRQLQLCEKALFEFKRLDGLNEWEKARVSGLLVSLLKELKIELLITDPGLKETLEHKRDVLSEEIQLYPQLELHEQALFELNQLDKKNKCEKIIEIRLCEKALFDLNRLDGLNEWEKAKVSKLLARLLEKLNIELSITDFSLKETLEQKQDTLSEEVQLFPQLQFCEEALDKLDQLDKINECKKELDKRTKSKKENVQKSLEGLLEKLNIELLITDSCLKNSLEHKRDALLDEILLYPQLPLNEEDLIEIDLIDKKNKCEKEKIQKSLKSLIEKPEIKASINDSDLKDSLERKRDALSEKLQSNIFKKPDSALEFEKQLGAIQLVLLEHISKLKNSSPYSESQIKRLKALEWLLSEREDGLIPFDNVYDKKGTSQNTNLVNEALAELQKLCPERFTKSDVENWLTDAKAYERIKIGLKEELSELGSVDFKSAEQTTLLSDNIEYLLNACVEKCDQPYKATQQKAKKDIEKMIILTNKLIATSKDKNLCIPYFNFIYSSEKHNDNDPLFIKLLIKIIANRAEVTAERILDLSKHPIFLPWALRELALNFAAAAG